MHFVHFMPPLKCLSVHVTFKLASGAFINIIVALYKAGKWVFWNLTTIQLATDIEVVGKKKKGGEEERKKKKQQVWYLF